MIFSPLSASSHSYLSMSPHPLSLSKHSDANPQYDNELGGRSNVTEPNSNSGGTHNTSPECQQRDYSQGAANSQVSGGQQPTSRGHTNVEYNGPGDLENPKCKLNQVLTEFSRSSKKSKSDSDSKYAFFVCFLHLLTCVPS
jgi:hypothetical protein